MKESLISTSFANKLLFSPTLIALSVAEFTLMLFKKTSLPETSIASFPKFSKYELFIFPFEKSKSNASDIEF